MSHHGNEDFEKAWMEQNQEKFKEMFKGNPQNMRNLGEMLRSNNSDIGATGRFPDGKMNEQDEGELKFAMTISEGKLIMNFGKPISWIGFTKNEASKLVDYILDKLNEIE